MGFKARGKVPEQGPNLFPRLARLTDVYYWLEVEVKRLNDDFVQITLAATGRKLPPVAWHWGQHFDPSYIWASYYPEEAGGFAGGFVGCPNKGEKAARAGYLLVNKNLPGVEEAYERQARDSPTLMTPKWPKSAG